MVLSAERLWSLTPSFALSNVLDMTPLSDQHRDMLAESAEEFAAAKRALDAAKAKREAAVHQAAAEGGSYREIAAAVGLAYQRVGQMLTGEKPPMMPFQINALARCPKCNAKPGNECTEVKRGKTVTRTTRHIERSWRAHSLFFGDEEPGAGEVGPLTTMYMALESLGIGTRAVGPIALGPAEVEAYIEREGINAVVAHWTGHAWKP